MHSSPNTKLQHTPFRPIAPSASSPSKSILPALIRPSTENGMGHASSAFSVSRKRSISPSDSMKDQALTSEQRQRRKDQNRAAQRAFRERKERYVKELEMKMKEMEEAHALALQDVQQENRRLRDAMAKLQADMNMMRKKRTGEDEIVDASHSDESTDDDEHKGKNVPKERAVKKIMRVPSSAVACIRDKDGVSFCERLKEEVCSSAYAQLLSEPLFDASGVLNSSVTQRPVPIVTDHVPAEDDGKEKRHDFNWFMEAFADEPLQPAVHHEIKLVSCSQVWARVSEHPQFDKFDLDALCDELKKKAKCSNDGPVLEEDELEEVLRKMEAATMR